MSEDASGATPGRTREPRRVRRLLLVVGAAVGLLAVGGGLGFLGGRLSAPVGRSADRAVRPEEKVQHAAAVRYGNLTFRPTGLTCGMHWAFGTHAELEAKGQYCRLGVVVENVDSTFHDLVTGKQRLVDSAGKAYAPSFDAMRAKRQPDSITIGARDAVEIDLWFDVPAGGRIDAARLVGDDDPSGIDDVVNTPRPSGGARVPLTM
ncbi:hypothetical protein I6A60_28605 [Frankia sp. AgB1.9]|uniref:hypothetical protein n=1 Tax=unclassified Frankia TaxID=2632575 RepID=UPI0019349C1D|nr:MULTISPECIES: hypothetical protein [unclassified Frankia]MBL7488673.1 hypothetical protein [Frankia sp. AgW1.1]MBL7551793.1 hypothetical protein [Frankia sp. AgB1.9]MBL7621114.1 hypothetical protein [Frankia sp. AgB1.8]